METMMIRVRFELEGFNRQIVCFFECGDGAPSLEDVLERNMRYYSGLYGTEVYIVEAATVEEGQEVYVIDKVGSPVCRGGMGCINLAVSRCFLCGCYCCASHVFPVEPALRIKWSVAENVLAVLCAVCENEVAGSK
ncbi:hypothetical protein EI42_06131 [Thermosporothrix hazakensis]|jgi:hypothetical protein|uniref:Uncharacterized protein n=1 Tax=Thermosporothrix hazakensis TaxID=644383 RepID=A0A326TTW8_THEHA|nr:hypothetical protein [Thermosporothrix hazakensis]PZW19318.1 hypothetical protein EI42_06131 [Thermosporothrix hazakensis]GCE48243.1 hypothetical protein KTH_31120 [Thermosporothrix hazakensis]